MRHKVAIAAAIVCLDWLVKWWVVSSGEFHIRNTGVSFGLGGPGLVMLGLAVIIILGYKDKRVWSETGWWLMLGGITANLGERLIMGGISDYMKVPLIGLWFNLADAAIMLGCIAILSTRGYNNRHENNL
ncbi:hypothetical protein A2368_03400 [Candidatus Collierbacteria bacterium RIFOXYB1_FULL_49_13]|uniref:Uncharacterized protein n=1 Tax=Candidatus Collierbacteria bacterium RIFOXYB1_FULL_49_13 TaxID=1817728 RepID=A0A1F5FJK1_9BACT|nr:MAG: hypothetical protein A2368_03400 [Candidatus Collierbacteria bacterium RIFOXYB1_FULL_49_13]